ncbi:MAG: CvpA family protein [Muribaculaceae bacterium]|nr:CvpA family protein [Muribaculaceae bacterium]
MAFDILIFVVAGVGCITGFVKGILGQFGQLAGLAAGVIFARLTGGIVGGWLASSPDGPTAFESVCGYTIAFFVAYLSVWLAVRALRAVVRALHLGIIDRLAGAVFTTLLWSLMLSLAVNLYAVATDDAALLDGDARKPWRTVVVRLAPVTLGYLGRETLNNISDKDVFNYIRQQSDNDNNE